MYLLSYNKKQLPRFVPTDARSLCYKADVSRE